LPQNAPGTIDQKIPIEGGDDQDDIEKKGISNAQRRINQTSHEHKPCAWLSFEASQARIAQSPQNIDAHQNKGCAESDVGKSEGGKKEVSPRLFEIYGKMAEPVGLADDEEELAETGTK
jgi:hypothetical protein